MPQKLKESEIKKHFYADADARYDYFHKMVIEELQFWTLKSSDGTSLLFLGGESDPEAIPVWSNPAFAERYAEKAPVEGYVPFEISVAKWLEVWQEKLTGSGVEICIFPTPDKDAVTLSVEEFSDLISSQPKVVRK